MTAPYRSVSHFGETTFHRRHLRFGIEQADRLSHIYAIGKTGVGKSTLLESLAGADLEAGRGFMVIDPHGDLAERLREMARPVLGDRLIYLDAADAGQSVGYNPLRRVRDDRIPLAAAGLLDALKKLWPDAWGVRMEHVLRNSLFALLEQREARLPDILRLYSDKAFRRGIAGGLRNPVVRRFWKEEFEAYPDRLRGEAVAPIQNKLGALLTDPRLYRIFVSAPVDLHFRALMDDGGVLIANLAKGRLGEDAAAVLGGFLVSTVGLAALSRADGGVVERRPFFLYVDEFQTFTTLAFANLLPELRKYGLGLTIAHQYLHQLDPAIRHAVIGNAGTLITFRVGAEDAGIMSAHLAPTFTSLDLMNLPNREFYTRLMIEGAPSQPFSARTLPLRSVRCDLTQR